MPARWKNSRSSGEQIVRGSGLLKLRHEYPANDFSRVAERYPVDEEPYVSEIWGVGQGAFEAQWQRDKNTKGIDDEFEF